MSVISMRLSSAVRSPQISHPGGLRATSPRARRSELKRGEERTRAECAHHRRHANTGLALALGFSLAERLPSADRSQQILNTAGRHRDSAARLCSGFLVLRSSGRRQFEAAMNPRRLPYLLRSIHQRRDGLAHISLGVGEPPGRSTIRGDRS
jgi:hypothetical protein